MRHSIMIYLDQNKGVVVFPYGGGVIILSNEKLPLTDNEWWALNLLRQSLYENEQLYKMLFSRMNQL